ncbi:MAG: hypothetical protein AB7O32_00130 [Vicinamibacterales bacterium]
MENPLKVGALAGAGPPPGYAWSVLYLEQAASEARSFLNEEQYAHAVDLLRTLAEEVDPRRAQMVQVESVEDFFELKDKGGVLGKINMRVFFIVLPASKAIVVLGAVKKEADGKTPTVVRCKIRVRKRRFEKGEFGGLPCVEVKPT